MKLTQVTYTARKGLPSYSHEEIVAVAMISEGNQAAQVQNLKALVDSILHGEATTPSITGESVVNGVSEGKKDVKAPTDKPAAGKAPTEDEAEVKAKKAAADQEAKDKAKAEKEAAAAAKKAEKEAADKAKAAEKASKKIEKYDRSIKDHTSTFAGYLTKTYGETWKTKEGLKAFSESLNGLDFRDETGTLVDSFKAKIEDFFGSGENVL